MMHTPWGYTVDELPPMVDEAAFNEATGNRYKGDLRLASALEAASAAVRAECGWHIAPSLACSAALTADGRIAQLPARLVTAIASVREDGMELSAGQFEARQDGLLRRACFRNWTASWGGVEVDYQAGFEETPADVAAIVARIAEAGLASPVGVSSETAGGVTVSYAVSQTAVAGAMTDAVRQALAPYRLVSAHAA